MVEGTASYKVACKLKFLKEDSKTWVKEEIRREGEEVHSRLTKLGDLGG